jgi:hypothetical protein
LRRSASHLTVADQSRQPMQRNGKPAGYFLDAALQHS